MNRYLPVLAGFALAGSLHGQIAITTIDISGEFDPLATGGNAQQNADAAAVNVQTVNVGSSFSNAFVVVGWSNDAGGTPVNTGAIFNGTAMSGVRGGSPFVGPLSSYDGNQGGFELFYLNVGNLAAGSYNLDLGNASNKPSAFMWIVSGTSGIRDTAYSLYIDDANNGGVGTGGDDLAFGFNLAGTVAPVATPFEGDTTIDVQPGDAVISWLASGSNTPFDAPSTITPLTLSQDFFELTIGSGGIGMGASGIVGSINPSIGFDSSGPDWFRNGVGAISFVPIAIPEPSAFGLVWGLGAVALLRRRRC